MRVVKPAPMARHTLSALALKARLTEAVQVAAETKKPQRIGDGDGLLLTIAVSGTASLLGFCAIAGLSLAGATTTRTGRRPKVQTRRTYGR